MSKDTKDTTPQEKPDRLFHVEKKVGKGWKVKTAEPIVAKTRYSALKKYGVKTAGRNGFGKSSKGDSFRAVPVEA